MKKKLRKLVGKRRGKRAEGEIIPENRVPRITNETVAAHREEVIGKARKYIYPLRHSKHRIVVVSITLFIVTIVVFFAYCTLALYRFQSSSTFLYRVTRVIPFPIARSGGQFIAYENYLFELRHYTHYYESQQELDFDSEAGQQQLAEFKRRALDKVISDAYIKQLAKKHNITVTDQEVEDQIAIVRDQNRLGDSERVFEDVLKDFWGWSVGDFKRSLHQQMLSQKVLATLVTETRDRAEAALEEIQSGTDFEEVASKYSDDPATKDNGGDFGFSIDQANRDLTAQTTDALFRLRPGETSGIINIGYALEIVKLIEKEDNRVRGAHILFTFKDINTYVNDLKDEQPARTYIKLPESNLPELPVQEEQQL